MDEAKNDFIRKVVSKMRICIIHGSPRKGNTFKATEILKKEMQNNGKVKFAEYFLPKDMPHFCCGCFTCFEKGEDRCPHAQTS